MRVKELADLAGTTTRTVRYYHRLGLLAVPPIVRGLRDYGIEHLARLLRIRWLAESGVPLAKIAQMLPEHPTGGSTDIEADLLATRAQIDARIEVLKDQRSRIDQLVARVRSGEVFSPLPVVLERFYDRIEVLVEDPATLPIVHTDRRMVLVLAISGLIPASLGPFIDGLSDEDHRAVASMLTVFAKLDRNRYPNAYDDEERERVIKELEETEWAVLERNRSTALAMLRDLPSGGPGHLLWKRVARLSKIGYPEPDQRRVIELLLRRVREDPEFGPVLEERTGKDWDIV
ncbi:MerR family transcriptional regulator [uncultured Actinomyces sp.]|uniref:MerR family transcriptional regulator n=1 Tax=uncultured Actinomyces sp. TaxID=249061 RepID=UPI00260AF2CC|nr:MerR family transcriptional regulator [uncultured Actinomyces sp.]